VVDAILAQRTERAVEVVLVDSGSPAEELTALRERRVKIVEVPPADFDHGLTRDVGAGAATGEALIFLNQDALPSEESWLERLLAPLESSPQVAAVQGAIRELPDEKLEEVGRRRFFWDSCGPRFYFTRESEGWIARHGGIGFSTVHCVLARWAWREQPFGRVAILEDKLWQRRAVERGWRIVEAPEAVVFHTHDYGLGSLFRRCASEGFGWRLVGERYRLAAALADLRRPDLWHEWRRGRRSGALRTPAEVLFPIVRPLAVWWGNRWARRVRH